MNTSTRQSQPKRRILFLISRFLDGGIDTVLTEYLNHLVHVDRYEVTLAIGMGMGELEVFKDRIPSAIRIVYLVPDGPLTKYPRQRAYHKLALPKKLADEILLNPIRRSMIRRRLCRLATQYDVLIDFDCCFYTYMPQIPTRKVAWFHFSFEQSMQQNSRRMKRIADKLQYYDKVVTISKAMCEEGRRLFPWLSEKLVVIYNAKERQKILQEAAKIPADPRLEQPFLLAVERLEESQKDILTLLKAYKLLRETYGHTEKLCLIGKGNSEEMLRQQAIQLGIGDDVVFLGFTPNPYPWIKASRLMVHSAKFEGLPTVLIEGLMLDKIIVASDCPTGPREILNDGKAGLLVPVGDAAAFADAIHKALTDDSLRQQLVEGIRAQQHVFSFEATDELFTQII